MSSTDGELGMRNLTDKATYERLEKDVAAVKNDIAALTEQITDALNSFAGTTKKQARRGYKQARANVDSAMEEASERGIAVMDAAQDAAYSIEETLEDVIAERPLSDRLRYAVAPVAPAPSDFSGADFALLERLFRVAGAFESLAGLFAF